MKRLEQLIQRAVPSPQQETIADAVDVIIYLERQNKIRGVREILEVEGYRNGDYVLKKIS